MNQRRIEYKNMNKDEKIIEINKLIGNRDFLKCELLYKRNSSEIKAILEMPEWEDEKFQGLLTSTIWSSNSSEVKAILEMPEWEDEKYSHLLKPSIFNISIKNIRPTIELFKQYGIDQYVSNSALRRNVKKQAILLKYLKNRGISLLEEDKDGNKKLNKIINASNTELKKKYHIDLEIIEKSERIGPSLDD